MSAEPILYLFLDGTSLRHRLEAERKEPVPVAYQIREIGRKVLLHMGPRHRERVRTTNVLERLFGEGRRRLKVISHFFTETAGVKLVYATLLATSRRWSGVAVNPIIAGDLTALWKNVFGQSRDETSVA